MKTQDFGTVDWFRLGIVLLFALVWIRLLMWMVELGIEL